MTLVRWDFSGGFFLLSIFLVFFFSPRFPFARNEPPSLFAQLRPTLCDPVDWGLQGFSVPGILQAGTLEWVAVSFSRASSWPEDLSLHLLCLLSMASRFCTTEPPGKPPITFMLRVCFCVSLKIHFLFQNKTLGTSLVIQWVWLHLPVRGVQVWSLIGEPRSHLPCGQRAKNVKQKQYLTNSVKTVKMVHVKKKS